MFWRTLTALALFLALAGCGGAAARPELDVQVVMNGGSHVLTVAVRGQAPRNSHLHFTLDGGPEIMLYSHTYTLPKLAPGSHDLYVYMSDIQHRPIPGVEKRVTFTVP